MSIITLRHIIFLPVFLFLFSCGTNDGSSLQEDSVSQTETSATSSGMTSNRIKINNIGRLQDIFNDSNHVQLQTARSLGIEPVADLKSSYFTRRPLIHIVSNSFYKVDSLSHSVPFLVPEAAVLLHDIGSNFIDSLASRGADGYTIRVTSLLRTPSTVRHLRRVNINATDSSTHQFATTFDISYIKFHPSSPSREIEQEDLKNLLAEVLLDLKKEKRCYVKYERKTGCFHVTAIR